MLKHIKDVTGSDSLCLAKWYNATIWLGSGQSTSCHHPPAHAIDISALSKNPSAIHNTLEKKADRAMMQKGERPPGCDYCWKIEDLNTNAVSDRVYKTKIYSGDDLKIAFATPAENDVNLKTLEIAFDRTCQFACSYCNPAFSTTWAKDINKNGPYENLKSDGRNHFTHAHNASQKYKPTENNPYVDAFFKWWESDLHSTLTELRVTGGEPLMSPYTWHLLEWFTSHKKQSTTRLAINSNLGFDKKVIDKLLTAANDVELDIYTSCEAVGIQAEYIRDGLVWDQWAENLHYLLQAKKLRCLHVMCTINAICLPSLDTLLKMIIDLRRQYGKDAISFTLNILRFPSFQSPLVLLDKLKVRYRNELNKFLDMNRIDLQDMEINHLQRLIDYLDLSNSIENLPALLNDFSEFYKQYDLRRGKDFKATFPQLAHMI